MHELTGGRAITVYAQHEVVKDLIAGAPRVRRADLSSKSSHVAIHGFDGDSPRIRYRSAGEDCEIACDFIAGCDGFHGICRPSIPAGALRFYEKTYPVRLAGHSGRSDARLRRADLRQPRARLRAAQHAHSANQPPVSAVPSRRGPRRVAGRAHLGGAAAALRDRRRLPPQRRPDPSEGRHRDAQLRRRADAVRPPVPGRRRRPHRAAHRRQRPQSRRRRRAHSGARAGAPVSRPAPRNCSTAIPRSACAASGARSTSPGG